MCFVLSPNCNCYDNKVIGILYVYSGLGLVASRFRRWVFELGSRLVLNMQAIDQRCPFLKHDWHNKMAANAKAVLTNCIGGKATLSECAAHPFRPDVESGTLRWWISLTQGRSQIRQRCEELTLTCPSSFGFSLLTQPLGKHHSTEMWPKMTTLRVQMCPGFDRDDLEWHTGTFLEFLRLCTPSLEKLIIENSFTTSYEDFESDLLLGSLCRKLTDVTVVCIINTIPRGWGSAFNVCPHDDDGNIRCLPEKTALRALGPLWFDDIIDFFNHSVGPKSLAELRCLYLWLSGPDHLADFCTSIVGKTPLLTELFIHIDTVSMMILTLVTPLFVIHWFPHS